MNFNLSSEQQMLVDSIDKFIAEHYELEQRQKFTRLKGGFDPSNWQKMAELGWLGLPFSEADGGFGGSLIDTMLLMEAFGRGLIVEPYLANVVLGGHLLAHFGTAAQKRSILPSIMDGSAQVALAYAEEQSHFDLFDVATCARSENRGLVISGQKSMVQNGSTAACIIASVRTSGSQYDQDGISLVILDAKAEGLNVTGFPTVDGLQAAEITFDEVRVRADQIIGKLGAGYKPLQSAIMHGTLAVCAEAVGAMEMLYKDTVNYIQEREQFDNPLAQFQVLRHRMVDMFMEYEQAKSLLLRATLEVEQQGMAADRIVHALKHLVGKTGIMIGENAVQTHGGMGMTEELRVGHYFKRLLVIDAQFGNADHHLNLFAA